MIGRRQRQFIARFPEGESDALAIRAICDLRGLDPELDDVEIIPMGGITNIGHHAELRADPTTTVIGLCDAAETHWVERAFGSLDGFHVCHADLEEELIRALGPDATPRPHLLVAIARAHEQGHARGLTCCARA